MKAARLWINVRSLPEMTCISPSSVTGGWPTRAARSLTTGIGAVRVSITGLNGPVILRTSLLIGSMNVPSSGSRLR